MPDNAAPASVRLGHNDMLFWNDGYYYYALRVERDKDPSNPREEDGDDNVARLCCVHPRYDLGDYTGENRMSTGEFLAGIVRESVPSDIIAKRLVEGVVPGYGPDDYETDPPETLEELKDRFLNALSENIVESPYNVTKKICKGFAVIMPLWLYDHSGITMSVGERTGVYADPWDSGCVGYAAITRNDALEKLSGQDANGKAVPLTDDTWEDAAVLCIRDEVEVYDMYLTGDVYWFQLYVRECLLHSQVSNDDDWEEDDACGGFYGTDPVRNGILDHVGHGIAEALAAGCYNTGICETRTVICYQFKMHDKEESR